jgi:serine-type D-Ala-D-Ala carboxypeptidase (penicillin-binding protein 5/6)
MTSTRITRLRSAETPTNLGRRWRRSIVGAVSALALAASIVPAGAAAWPSDIDDLGNTTPSDPNLPDVAMTMPSVTADAAIVIDRGTGAVLGTKHPDLRWAPASTTKIMTGLLAAEAIDSGAVSLDDIVTIPSDVNIEGGGSAGLVRGDTISLRDLLYMTLIPSKNDAASAVGTYLGTRVYAQPQRTHPDSQTARTLARPTARTLFVAAMNARAAELGLDATSYVDISGRDPEDLNENGDFPAQAGCEGNDFDEPACAHYTTARDLASLARVALDNPVFAQIVNTPEWTTTTWVGATRTDPYTTYTTSNQLLPGQPYEYSGAYGVKTGTTDRAGENLVSAARAQSQDVIAVALGSDSSDTVAGNRFTDSRALLGFGLGQ